MKIAGKLLNRLFQKKIINRYYHLAPAISLVHRIQCYQVFLLSMVFVSLLIDSINSSVLSLSAKYSNPINSEIGESPKEFGESPDAHRETLTHSNKRKVRFENLKNASSR